MRCWEKPVPAQFCSPAAPSVFYSSGAVVDVTSGSVVSSGSPLIPNHRYLTAEDTSASFRITSPTAVLDYQGSYSFSYSGCVDYNAMASALKTLHLFKGTFTGYGEGFDLEAAPTRLQALIMFIRVLGEEDAGALLERHHPLFAILHPGSQAERYVGYAYEKGYTNGYSATAFHPSGAVNAYQYTEFVLRAMGYSSSANTDLSTTLIRAAASGVLMESEVLALQQGQFLRAHLVYISYAALNAPLAGEGDTLADGLMDMDIFTAREWRQARRRWSPNMPFVKFFSPAQSVRILWIEAARSVYISLS